MLPYILAAVGGYLIGDSLKGKQYAKGGMMAKGGKTESYSELRKVPKKVAGELSLSPSRTAKLTANKLMLIDNNIWEELDINSGSQLYNDDELQKKYVEKLEKANVDKIISSENLIRSKVMDLLEENNYSSLHQYFIYKGIFGEAKRNDYIDMYNSGGSYMFLNPVIFTSDLHGKPFPNKPKMAKGGESFANGGIMAKGMMATGGRIKVGTFSEEQLKNKEDKKAVEKAQKESGLTYVDTKIIKKGGKMYLDVYLIPNEEYYNSSKYAEGGMMATGGKTESQEELLDAAIASKELKEKARKKIKGSDAVLAVAYTDYGGTFGDKALIEFFKKNYPRNIVYEKAGYNGQNAILFGEPVKEYLDSPAILEDFYMEMQMELEKKEFKDFIKYLKEVKKIKKPVSSENMSWDGNDNLKYKVSPNTFAWLLDNYQEIGLSYSIEPNGIDFSPESLEEVLIEEGLIKKL